MVDGSTPGTDGRLAALLETQAIREVVLRYCRGVDRLDLDLVRSAYHPGALDHHTGFDGPVEEYVAWLGRMLPRLGGTQHLVANHLVELAGDRALSETYGTAVHWGEPAEDPGLNFTSGFRYVDLMERRDGRWAIAERYAVREWTRSDAGRVRGHGRADAGTGPDPLELLRARL